MAHACVSTSASSIRFTAGFVSASPNVAWSFLQAISKDEVVAHPLRVVQIEGLAVLKIIKHCKEFATTQGCAKNNHMFINLGLDVGSVLEVTNVFLSRSGMMMKKLKLMVLIISLR